MTCTCGDCWDCNMVEFRRRVDERRRGSPLPPVGVVEQPTGDGRVRWTPAHEAALERAKASA